MTSVSPAAPGLQLHEVRVYPSADTPPREQLLAWKLAEAALDDTPLDDDVSAMIVNRVIDNTGVAVAALLRRPVANARAQALAHRHEGGATVYGLPPRSGCIANGPPGPTARPCASWTSTTPFSPPT